MGKAVAIPPDKEAEKKEMFKVNYGMTHCTMLLQLQLESEKFIKSKWLDFTRFSTKYYLFGFQWCENANI